MTHPDSAVVTGAFSYTGRYIARRLLEEGVNVRTLTRRTPADDPFDGRVPASPLDFSGQDALRRSLDGAGVLYNTYWVRYGRGETSFQSAVENSRILFEAARDAGVEKIVHISVSNPTTDSPLPYFKGKADVEEILMSPSVSHMPSSGQRLSLEKATFSSATWRGR